MTLKSTAKPLVGVPAVQAFHKDRADRYIVASIRHFLQNPEPPRSQTPEGKAKSKRD